MVSKNAKIASVLIVLIAIVVGIVVYETLLVIPAVPAKYTTGLTVGMHVVDATTGTPFSSGITLQEYTVGSNPFAYLSTLTYSKIGFYTTDTILGSFWALTGMSVGSYQVITYQPSAQTCYPASIPISVAGTNNVNLEVWATPNEIDMPERATTTITVSGYAYNATAQTYSIPLTGTPLSLNTTRYTKFWLTYTITVTGVNKQVEAGRMYLTNIAGITPTSYSLDGSTATSLGLQTDSSVNGQLGYYIPFASPFLGGSVHRLDVYISAPSPISATTSMVLKQFEDSACPNTYFRWWLDVTSTVSLTK